MKLIIGLGNPENEENYANTRHNMGFRTVNKLAEKFNINITRKKFNGLYGMGTIFGEKVVIVKPQTYMNLSGEAIADFVDFYKVSLDDIIVIYDDVDIKPGRIRIRKSGSSGSHNGMKSVVQYLASKDFARIRVGIGKPKFANDMINYVIGSVPDEEMKILEQGVVLAEEALEMTLKDGIDKAMNTYNSQDIKEEE